ncbi:MAG: tRNA-dihydrouridine synthase [Pseudomonadota bacterium]
MTAIPAPSSIDFVDAVAEAGAKALYIHARKAWLKGLSPKENRDIPPLDYDRVRALKARLPEVEIILNGGINTLDGIQAALTPTDDSAALDGVMIGREAYQNPLFMAAAEQLVFSTGDVPKPSDILVGLSDYVADRIEDGTPLKSITRHLMGLMNGRPGARAWRRFLSAVPQDDGITWHKVVEKAWDIDRAVRGLSAA